MATDSLYGWDLTFKTIEKDVTRKSDVIIAFVHFNLMKRGFRSIGIGDERSLAGDEEKTELLPTGWNDKENYTIRYVLDNKLYILHGLLTDGNLIINLMRSEDLAVSNVVLNVDDKVKDMRGPLDKLMPDYTEVMYNIRRDLIAPFTDQNTSTAETQTTNKHRPLNLKGKPMPESRLLSNRHHHHAAETGLGSKDLGSLPTTPSAQLTPMFGPTSTSPVFWYPDASPRGIGSADRDPLAQGGGGMIFNPFAPRRSGEFPPGLGVPGGIARGSVPPGARFDPFGPPGINFIGRGRSRSIPPDADHLPPPGFNDNMFM